LPGKIATNQVVTELMKEEKPLQLVSL